MNKQSIHRHGEAVLKPVMEIPKEAKLISSGKSHTVAHSESGHHHVLELALPKLKVYEFEGRTFLDLGQKGNLVHKKESSDKHKTQTIWKGLYEVIIKREFNYFKKMMERVQD